MYGKERRLDWIYMSIYERDVLYSGATVPPNHPGDGAVI